MEIKFRTVTSGMQSGSVTDQNYISVLWTATSIKIIFECLIQDLLHIGFEHELTAWKVSKYGVFSGPCFPVFGLEKTPYLDTFHVLTMSSSNYNMTNKVFWVLTTKPLLEAKKWNIKAIFIKTGWLLFLEILETSPH